MPPELIGKDSLKPGVMQKFVRVKDRIVVDPDPWKQHVDIAKDHDLVEKSAEKPKVDDGGFITHKLDGEIEITGLTSTCEINEDNITKNRRETSKIVKKLTGG